MLSNHNPPLTVLIPLHQAQPWLEIISENISLCPQNCRIIISDATRKDSALNILSERHRDDTRLCFVNHLTISGWRLHINCLMNLVESDFFSILPQDDSIMAGYYEKLLRAIETREEIALSFAPIRAENYQENKEQTIFPHLPIQTLTNAAWQEAIELERRWNLGIAFRGVVRKSATLPIAATSGDMQADIYWVFSIALQGHLVEVVDTTYCKRYHRASAHAGWRAFHPFKHQYYLNREILRVFYKHPSILLNALISINFTGGNRVV